MPKDPRGRKPALRRRALAVELYAQGLTMGKIGRRLGVSRQAVQQLLCAAVVTYHPVVLCPP